MREIFEIINPKNQTHTVPKTMYNNPIIASFSPQTQSGAVFGFGISQS